jgi:hypothetical protein
MLRGETPGKINSVADKATTNDPKSSGMIIALIRPAIPSDVRERVRTEWLTISSARSITTRIRYGKNLTTISSTATNPVARYVITVSSPRMIAFAARVSSISVENGAVARATVARASKKLQRI